MNALEKAAWAEMLVAIGAVVLCAVLFPILGHGALGGFGFLGFAGLAALFLRKRGDEVVVDERDREIDSHARHTAIKIAYYVTLFVLMGILIWHGSNDVTVVSLPLLQWVLWGQIALLLFAKGLIAILAYRSPSRAA